MPGAFPLAMREPLDAEACWICLSDIFLENQDDFQMPCQHRAHGHCIALMAQKRQNTDTPLACFCTKIIPAEEIPTTLDVKRKLRLQLFWLQYSIEKYVTHLKLRFESEVLAEWFCEQLVLAVHLSMQLTRYLGAALRPTLEHEAIGVWCLLNDRVSQFPISSYRALDIEGLLSHEPADSHIHLRRSPTDVQKCLRTLCRSLSHIFEQLSLIAEFTPNSSTLGNLLRSVVAVNLYILVAGIGLLRIYILMFDMLTQRKKDNWISQEVSHLTMFFLGIVSLLEYLVTMSVSAVLFADFEGT
jgi:hypothetical protein